MALEHLSDDQIQAALTENGSQARAAAALGVAKSSLQIALTQRGLSIPVSRRPKITLTREALHSALQPPNNCRVAGFREELDADSQYVLDEALGYDKRDFPASKLREFLIAAGFREQDVPGVDAINAHRSGQRPCRCKG